MWVCMGVRLVQNRMFVCHPRRGVSCWVVCLCVLLKSVCESMLQCLCFCPSYQSTLCLHLRSHVWLLWVCVCAHAHTHICLKEDAAWLSNLQPLEQTSPPLGLCPPLLSPASGLSPGATQAQLAELRLLRIHLSPAPWSRAMAWPLLMPHPRACSVL